MKVFSATQNQAILCNLLENITKKTLWDGTYRTISPSDTISKVNRYMTVMGITRTANVTGLDRIGIPVVVVFRPNSRSLSVSQGKGVNLVSAKASALMESVESFHAERIDLSLKLSSCEDLKHSYRLANIDKLPRTTNSVFHPSLTLLWVDGYDLISQKNVLVPYELVHTNYTLPKPSGSDCFNASSNGLASGNHLLEAIIHGLCEVIERDATTLWYLFDQESRDRTRIDLRTVNDPICRSLLDKYENAKIDVAVWETTSDIRVPTFICFIVERDPSRLRLLHSAAGMGCHPVRSIALSRALTEAAQSRLTVITGSRDDVFRENYEISQNPFILRRDRRFLDEPVRMKDFSDGSEFNGDTFEDDLKWLLNCLQSVNIEQAIVINLTRKEFQIPVVRVIVPGLEGLSSLPGYCPGDRANLWIRK